MLPGANRKINPLALPPFGRQEDERGIVGWMDYYTTPMPAPNVPILQRASLGQPILRHKLQNSHYAIRPPISWVGMYLAGYPWFKGQATVQTNSTTQVRPTPVVQKRSFFTPGTASGAGMGAMRRFGKALPLPIQNFSVPLYGQYSEGEGPSV